MNRLRDHFRNTDIRKAELDPSTFEHAEEWQRDDQHGHWPLVGYGTSLLIGIAFWVGVCRWAGWL